MLLLLLLGSCRLLGSYGNVDARVRLGRKVAHDGFPRRNAEIERDKSIKWTYSCIYTEINGYSAIRITITRPWSSLVAGDEGSYLPNGRSNLVITVHALSLLLFKFTVGLIRSFISRWQSHSPTRLPCLVTPHPHPIFRCNCCNPNTACITYLVNEPDLMESDLNDALKVFFKSRKIPLTANSISSSSGNSSSSSSSQS